MSRSQPLDIDEPIAGLSFDESAIKSKMVEIEGRFEKERETLKNAVEKLGKKEAKARLAVKFLQLELLSNAEARQYVQKAIDEGTKLTVPDIEGIVTLEVEPEQLAVDLAKFDCETSKQHYDKLVPQLSFLQSEMKLM